MTSLVNNWKRDNLHLVLAFLIFSVVSSRYMFSCYKATPLNLFLHMKMNTFKATHWGTEFTKGPLHVFQEASINVGLITALARAFNVSHLLSNFYLHRVPHTLSTALLVLTIPSNVSHFMIFVPFMKWYFM